MSERRARAVRRLTPAEVVDLNNGVYPRDFGPPPSPEACMQEGRDMAKALGLTLVGAVVLVALFIGLHVIAGLPLWAIAAIVCLGIPAAVFVVLVGVHAVETVREKWGAR